MRIAARTTLAGLMLLMFTATAKAQAPSLGGNPQEPERRVTLSPYFGINIPTADLVKLSTTHDTTSGQDTSSQEVKMAASVTFGARLGIGLSRRVGIQADVGYSPGSLQLSQSGADFNQDIRVLSGSGKLIFYIVPRSNPLWLNVSGGLGMVRHTFKEGSGGTSDLKPSTNVGGVVGSTAGIRLGKVVALTASIEDYLYNAQFDISTGTTTSQKQNDIRITGGIHFPFIGI